MTFGDHPLDAYLQPLNPYNFPADVPSAYLNAVDRAYYQNLGFEPRAWVRGRKGRMRVISTYPTHPFSSSSSFSSSIYTNSPLRKISPRQTSRSHKTDSRIEYRQGAGWLLPAMHTLVMAGKGCEKPGCKLSKHPAGLFNLSVPASARVHFGPDLKISRGLGPNKLL